jgi:hypothetical protein
MEAWGDWDLLQCKVLKNFVLFSGHNFFDGLKPHEK